jgi:hypothetical protein
MLRQRTVPLGRSFCISLALASSKSFFSAAVNDPIPSREIFSKIGSTFSSGTKPVFFDTTFFLAGLLGRREKEIFGHDTPPPRTHPTASTAVAHN